MDLEEYNDNNFKNTYIDSEVPSICKDEPCVLGIDEAGRGPVLDDTVDNGVKRHAEQMSPPVKRQKLATTGTSTQPKNPVSHLNELYVGLVYNSTMEGPTHAPLFIVTVNVNGQDYSGTGKSKKIAKFAAAAAAIKKILGVDYGYDNSETKSGNNGTQNSSNNENEYSQKVEKSSVPSGDGTNSNTTKSPMMVLNEIRKDVEYLFKHESGQSHSKMFIFQVKVDGETFEGSGNSKKAAKAAAARSALSKIVGGTAILNSTSENDSNTPSTGLNQCQTMADKIAQLVFNKFMELTGENDTLSSRKVLAGIVMSNSENEDDMRVVSVTTGTKCASMKSLDAKGETVSDSHAEVLARRCFIHFLFGQLEKHLGDMKGGIEPNTILESLKNGSGFRVKSKYKIHLYINTAPCGDARMFSPHEVEKTKLDTSKRQNQGLLRTKIESGEGTIPVKVAGISGQEDLVKRMSCSDKIARWNVVGLQGSLLAHVLEPVYLESIVVGALFNSNHLYRAVIGRLEESIVNLPRSFKINHPKLNQGSSTEARHPTKAPSFSVNWDCEDRDLEIITAVTGRQENGKNSRLCKQNFLKRLCTLLDHPNATTLTRVDNVDFKKISYKEVKALSVDYQKSKKAVASAFSEANLGQWSSKSLNDDSFMLDN